MCIALRCELAPRQHIAAVVLTGSSFRQDAQPHRYRLELSIQNQATTSVATPAVELTLTDAQDQVLVRKVLLPSDIGARSSWPPRPNGKAACRWSPKGCTWPCPATGCWPSIPDFFFPSRKF